MNRAAIGIRAHSGWAAVVSVAGHIAKPTILDRQRVIVVDRGARGASQPYHFAKELALSDAETHLACCATASRRLAAKGLQSMVERARNSGYETVGCGVLTASGRAIPALRETLASHAMIHTAEGEFFRHAFAEACNQLGLPVWKFPERDLEARAAAELRATPGKIKSELTKIGRDLGPPWTQDQKSAALVALLLLAANSKRR
jgi:hypothetical protein